MISNDQANVELFQADFISGKRNLTAWLSQFLSSGDAYPFLMGGPQNYDLGDLLRALLPPARNEEQQLLEIAFQKSLARAAHGFDLEALRSLSHAAARSGFNTIAFDLANTIEIVMLKLEQASWEEDERAAAYLAVDQIIAALATFAFDGSKNAMRVSRILFAQNVLAPFSSSLFTPLALSDLSLWPTLWKQLLSRATHRDDVLGQQLEEKWGYERLGIRAAHFDVFHVFQDFLSSAIAKGYSLQEIYDAASLGDLDTKTKSLAEIALAELEERGLIIRRPEEDCDKLTMGYGSADPNRVEPEPQRRLVAKVEPSTRRDWRPAAGRTPQQYEELLDKEAHEYV
jgi:hypothetical protein